ncbi:Cd(II)/Pb(II)-responsive transcriptional regulator [Roseateles sp. SL47]|uniref:Cd(II)/Pb(II)-responsive transcriptional regulator n=1 Tax=Roseateles sp. SL47 TaxID=2995138 RepID=UPI00226DEE7F|nr:Cd(II)/Pb(II)-responsive transcriptional regulator [Roseateles sp. SL47]WAC74271.1 Cd(II)/Pb(II)-responsive transcriptional regulator [Roseateles sp. SL47]
MRIGELSRATGVDIDTIRFYEKSGLLPPPARSDNGYRDYSHNHLERLAFIRHCRALDMSLADVSVLLSSLQSRDPAELAQVDGLVAAQLGKVRARLKSMQALEAQLVALQNRCDADHNTHPCRVLEELVAAAHGEACACHAASQEPHHEHPQRSAAGPAHPLRTADVTDSLD